MRKQKSKSMMAGYLASLMVGTLCTVGFFFIGMWWINDIMASLITAGIVGSAMAYAFGNAVMLAVKFKEFRNANMKGGRSKWK